MGRAPCCEKVGLKRGRWTAEEDRLLIGYIQANGEGSWRALPKNAGLLRCGKSCRLRWINYLRSDLKRGNISVEEEELIVKLQASLGNRWSLIAGHLAGRTDNEIKNYWNSHLSKKHRGSQNTSDQNRSHSSSIPSPESEDSATKAAVQNRKHKVPGGSKTQRPKRKKKKLIISITDASTSPSTSEQPSKAEDNNAQENIFDDVMFRGLDPLAGDALGSASGEDSAGSYVMCSPSTSTTDSRPPGMDYDQELCTSDYTSFEDLLAVDSAVHHDLRGLLNTIEGDFVEGNAIRDVADDVDWNKWDIDHGGSNLTAVFGEEAQDMLSWLWDFEDDGISPGAGAGAGVGELEYGNVLAADEKHDAMAAWLLS